MSSRIAVLSDIHANPFALEAVIDDIARQGVDEVLVGGDMVGRGALGSDVLDMITHMGWQGVRGNHEDYLINFHRKTVEESWLSAPEWAAARWMAAELRDEQVDLIAALPFSRSATSAPGLRLVHGTPAANNQGLGEWTDEAVVRAHLERIDEPLLVCAHTHRPMRREVDGRLVVNVGSVGLPFNADPRAQYAIFTHRPSGWDVEFRQVAYDRDAILRAYQTSGFMDAGGPTAVLLARELEHARPFLVPFIKWVAATQCPPDFDSMANFLDVYRPEMSLREFTRLLSA